MSQVEQASHPCAACGGSGDTLSTTDIPAGMECGVAEPEGAHILNGLGWVMCGMPAKYRDKTKRVGDGMYDSGDGDAFLCAYHAEDGRYQLCPVCLGAGRISDKMPARDAMSDAETLRLHYAPQYQTQQRNARAFWKWFQLMQAYRSLADVAHDVGTDVHSAVKESARAAFRTCPGLRGE